MGKAFPPAMTFRVTDMFSFDRSIFNEDDFLLYDMVDCSLDIDELFVITKDATTSFIDVPLILNFLIQPDLLGSSLLTLENIHLPKLV